MTRTPAAVPDRLRRLSGRTPLRVKLVAAVLLLVIAALAGSGFAAVATLRSYLVGRVDSQLRDAERPILEHQLSGVVKNNFGHDDGPGPGRFPDGGGQSHLTGAIVVEVTDARGAVVFRPDNTLIDSSQPLPALPHRRPPTSSRTFTVSAVSGGDQWRVLATPVTLTDGTSGTLLVAQSLSDVQSTSDRLILLLVIIGAAAVVVLAGVGYALVRASLRPLREVERAATRIAAGDLAHRVPEADPRTEIGQLTGALNTMLGEIETAFAERAASAEAARHSEETARRSEDAARRSEERMRRFVADASHELRTPLTSIRGFAELYRHSSASGEVDVARLMMRIEDEAKRMGLLVEDLLMLARLDQQRPFQQVPVDLLALSSDAVHDARLLAPDRRIELHLGATDPPPIVVGDEPRLRQVLANLVGNALRHTPAGTPVTVRVGSSANGSGAAMAAVEVADEGPGMAEDEAARVFERFYRADPSRNRDEGGSGLGLAIVSALVAAHGGRVQLRTKPGAGACFRVELPLAGAHDA